MVGNVGGSGRFAYSVVGDSVNTAARLESLNKQLGTRILASDARGRRAARAAVAAARPVPGGRPTPAAALVEVLGRGGEPHDDRAARAPSPTALARFEARALTEAAARFEAILAAHPADGPARFTSSAAGANWRRAAAAREPGVIRLEHK